MEFTRLPWEERWRRDKERRKRILEEGSEGIEQDNRELRRIVAFNDSRMGLISGRNDRVGMRTESGTQISKDTFGDNSEGLGDSTLIYRVGSYPTEMFKTLREFWESSLLTDLTLMTETGRSFNVHSPILASISSFIRERLKEKSVQQLDNDEDVHSWSVSLGPEVHHVGLQAVLEFAYTGDVSSLNKDTVTPIKAAAQVLGVPRVLCLCNTDRSKESGNSQKELKEDTSAPEQMKITLQSIERLWSERVGCDVTLDVDGAVFHVFVDVNPNGEYRAVPPTSTEAVLRFEENNFQKSQLFHKVILAASSDYFRGMFTSGMRESHQSCIALPFPLASELEALIGCSYSGLLPLNWDCVFEITCTALQLQFQSALTLCLKFMHQEMDATSCLDVASFAEAYEMSELLEEANDFVLRNFWDVSATAKFQDLQAEKLLDFLRCDGLCVPSELAVFRAVISWIQADPEERQGQASLLMTGVRFPLMTFREFREVRAVNLRMECFGDKDVELYGSALKEFGFGFPTTQDQFRVRRPREALVLVGGDQLNPDMGYRIPSRELWFANSLRSGTGLVKEVEWRRLGEIPDQPKFRHGVAALGGRLYVMGGCYFYTKDDIMKSAYSYDPEQDSWKRLADMQEFRSNFSVVVQGERLYAIGGDKEINTNVDSVEMYNPDTDSWSFVRPLDQALSGQAVTVLDGGIFISGGFDCKYICLVSMFLYHPERGTTYLADMACDRAQHCMEALRGRLYVAGGVCNLRKFYTDQLACEVYSPVTDSWTAFTSLLVPHVSAASAVLEEKVYILGGYCQEDYSESGLVHRFEPSSQRWENMGRLPGPVTDIRACLLRLPLHFRQRHTGEDYCSKQ